MPYMITTEIRAPYIIGTELVGWEDDVKSVKERVRVIKSIKWGRIDPSSDLLPKSAKLVKKRNSIPDFFHTTDRFRIVSSQFKDLITTLDPKRNHFWEIPMKNYNDAQFKNSHFIMSITECNDTINDDLSNVYSISGSDDDNSLMRVRPYKRKIIINTSSVSGAHIWLDKRYPGTILVSDLLGKEIRANNLKFPTLWNVKENN